MSGQRWKAQERQVAKALGGQRLPNNGRGQPDVLAPGNLAVQVKTRAAFPAWLWQAMDQAERDAGPDEAAAVVLAEVVAGRKAKRLVVMEFDAFVALIAGAGRAPPVGYGLCPPAAPTTRPRRPTDLPRD